MASSWTRVPEYEPVSGSPLREKSRNTVVELESWFLRVRRGNGASPSRRAAAPPVPDSTAAARTRWGDARAPRPADRSGSSGAAREEASCAARRGAVCAAAGLAAPAGWAARGAGGGALLNAWVRPDAHRHAAIRRQESADAQVPEFLFFLLWSDDVSNERMRTRSARFCWLGLLLACRADVRQSVHDRKLTYH